MRWALAYCDDERMLFRCGLVRGGMRRATVPLISRDRPAYISCRQPFFKSLGRRCVWASCMDVRLDGAILASSIRFMNVFVGHHAIRAAGSSFFLLVVGAIWTTAPSAFARQRRRNRRAGVPFDRSVDGSRETGSRPTYRR